MVRVLSFDVGIRHLAFVDISCSADGTYAIHGWDVLDVTQGDGISKKKGAFDLLSRQILATLDACFNDPDIMYDVVLIENQPANKNPMMKSVQMTIYTYFNCLSMFVGNVGTLKLVAASRKTTCMTHMPPPQSISDNPANQSDKKTTHPAKNPNSDSAKYRERKLESIRIASHYLEHVLRDQASLNVLRLSKKKDDLCDCLLQGLWYLESTGIKVASTTSQATSALPPSSR